MEYSGNCAFFMGQTYINSNSKVLKIIIIFQQQFMRPWNPRNKEELYSIYHSEPFYQTQLSRTPQKNKSEKNQGSTASVMELTPLVSPRKLVFNLIPFQFKERLEEIRTPCRPKYTHMFGLFDQTPITQTHLDYSLGNFIFDEEKEHEVISSHSASEQSNSQNDNHQENDYQDSDSKEFPTDNDGLGNPEPNFQLKEPKRPSPENSQDSKPKEQNSKKCVCNCKKTQCLKLYCDCFREGESCGSTCQCNSCHNTIEHEEQRSEVRRILMKRNPEAFDAKIINDQHSKGCNCKKTLCIKKYCECYQAGKKCGTHCKCEECKNGHEESYGKYDKEEKYKNTVKKERRMKEVWEK